MIDIIIPVYNSLGNIERTLSSILCQLNTPKMKIYIIDDGSVDDYTSVLNTYGSLLDISYIKLEKNTGPGNARNVGLNKSSGEYIIFLDSDDIFFTPLTVSLLYNCITSNDVDVVKSNVLLQKDNVFNLKQCENISLHGKIYRRSFIEKNKVNFIKTYMNEDLYFNSLLFLYGAKYKDLDQVTYIWCNNKESLCRKNENEHYYYDLINHSNTILDVYRYFTANDLNKERSIIFLAEGLIYTFMNYNLSNDECLKEINDSFIEIKNLYEELDDINNIGNNLYDYEMVSYFNRHKDSFYDFIK